MTKKRIKLNMCGFKYYVVDKVGLVESVKFDSIFTKMRRGLFKSMQRPGISYDTIKLQRPNTMIM